MSETTEDTPANRTSRHTANAIEAAGIKAAKQVLATARTEVSAITRDLTGVGHGDSEAIEDLRLRLRRLDRVLRPLGQPPEES